MDRDSVILEVLRHIVHGDLAGARQIAEECDLESLEAAYDALQESSRVKATVE